MRPRALAKTGLALLVLALVVFATRGYWLPAIAGGLMCNEASAIPDVLVLENFDPSYLVFERAAMLQRSRPRMRIVVPVAASARDPATANPISLGIAELMARFARLENMAVVPVRHAEPYALTAAYQVRDYLVKERLRSVVVVAPAFRSRRSLLVYEAVLAPAAIRVSCVPVLEGHTPEDWWRTWHGRQVVAEQFVKLQFYRFWALRTARSESEPR